MLGRQRARLRADFAIGEVLHQLQETFSRKLMGLPNAPVDPRPMAEADWLDLSKQSILGDSEGEELGDHIRTWDGLPNGSCKLRSQHA